ncbi:MAG TPA: glycosyltransferase family 1 protein [Sphingomicrobium sp.]|nr:glycosyltransferase family 1 protein [Sphingomicrobium sp.]
MHSKAAIDDRGSNAAPAGAAKDAAAGRQLAAGLRVALFSGNYNCVRDGANRALNRLVRFLLDHGAAVRVYSPTIGAPAFEPAGDLVSIPSFGIPTRREYRIAPRLTNRARRDIRQFAPTHFHLSAPDWLGTGAQAFAEELGVPVVISHHTEFQRYLEYYGLSVLAGWMERRVHRFYSRADYLLAPNQPIADALTRTLPDANIAIWGRGVDRTVFSPERRDREWRRALGYADEEPVVLFFGRIVVEKGLDAFAGAVEALRARGHRITPLVVGDGPALGQFRERLGDVRSTGHLEDVDLGRAVASADILINPSQTEAFGNVNLEAMACALAIVSARVDSSTALLEDGQSGLLVEPADVGAYAEAAERLIASADERRRLGRAALEASKRYNWDEVLRAVVRSYRAVERA